MTIDRDLWLKDSFSSRSKMPNWPCPICNKGFLQKDGESIKQYYSEETLKAKRNPVYQTKAMAEFRFSGYIKCSNCSERIIISGKGIFKAINGDKQASAIFLGRRYSVFLPKYFEPELPIFRLLTNLSASVKLNIIRSFSFFWYDLDSCANKIRQAIEIIVAEKEAVGACLDQKINNLRKELGDDLTDTLLALKWIGNEGSHVGRPFTREEILDAYSLLVDVLDRMYPDKSVKEKHKALVKKIIKKKGMKKP